MNIDEAVKKELERNKELAEVLKDKEKLAQYIKKMRDINDQNMGIADIPKRQCDTCVFSHGKSVFENSPAKSYCEMYPKAKGIAKPKEVYFDGGRCIYYVMEAK